MIQKQLHNRPKIRPEKLGGRKITIPAQYVKPKEALQQYSDRSPAEMMAHFYEEEGQPIPDFDKMDKIEKLEALNEWREKARSTKSTLDERNKLARMDYEKMVKEQEIQSIKQLIKTEDGTANKANT